MMGDKQGLSERGWQGPRHREMGDSEREHLTEGGEEREKKKNEYDKVIESRWDRETKMGKRETERPRWRETEISGRFHNGETERD